VDWIVNDGDKDGDGFVEYQRLNDQGLINQGWKDSWDGINFADGTLAEPPIALCEVQAYVYVAYLSRAWLAYEAGDTALGEDLSVRRRLMRFRISAWTERSRADVISSAMISFGPTASARAIDRAMT
jgi:glycogen debranching enzyme